MLYKRGFEKTSGNARKLELCDMTGFNSSMRMNINVWQLDPRGRIEICSDRCETAILIVSGAFRVKWRPAGGCDGPSGKGDEIFRRSSPFAELPWALHVSRGTAVTVTAIENSELVVEQTDTEKVWEPVLYRPEDCDIAEFGKGQWDGAGHRRALTVFDLSNAPQSNLVLGEVFNKPGRWSSYPPHHHPQPEVYYYRFDRPQGFGACFNGDDVFKSTDRSFCCIEPGKSHQQVTAPGYEMYYVWMIRHLEGDPWDKTRITDREHEWLL